MAGPRAGRQHPANCRHCHVRCHSMADRVCGARRCWQGQERACVWYYSSGLMSDKTKPESIVIATHKFIRHRVNLSQNLCRLAADILHGVFLCSLESENVNKINKRTECKCRYEWQYSSSVSFGLMQCARQLQQYVVDSGAGPRQHHPVLMRDNPLMRLAEM